MRRIEGREKQDRRDMCVVLCVMGGWMCIHLLKYTRNSVSNGMWLFANVCISVCTIIPMYVSSTYRHKNYMLPLVEEGNGDEKE